MNIIKHNLLLSNTNIYLIKINALFMSQCYSIAQSMHDFRSKLKDVVFSLLQTQDKEAQITTYLTIKAALFFGIKNELLNKKNENIKINATAGKKRIKYHCYGFKPIEKKKNTLKTKKNIFIEK